MAENVLKGVILSKVIRPEAREECVGVLRRAIHYQTRNRRTASAFYDQPSVHQHGRI